ncbi:MAG: PEP/pyruvate-binding domain-containing protein [Pseudomonadota bacterium]
MKKLWARLFGGGKPDGSRGLQEKYVNFRELLAANNEALQLITGMAEKLQGDTLFGMGYVRGRCTDLAVQTFKIIDRLEHIMGAPDPALRASFQRINLAIQAALKAPHREREDAFVLPFSRIEPRHYDDVGSKSLNLGLMHRNSGARVPPGFAVTARAWELFEERNRLQDRINKEKLGLSEHPAAIEEAAQAIVEVFETAVLPEEVGEAILSAYRGLRQETGCPKVSVRSSAVGEDSAEASFAGLHASFLGVEEAGLLQAYRQVLASKYTPRAIFYRLGRGVRDEDVAMCATCMAMVEATSSGVAFSMDPSGDSSEDTMVIHAVRGLGLPAVDGTASPEFHRLDRNTLALRDTRPGAQDTKLTLNPDGEGVVNLPIGPEEAALPYISEAQARDIARLALDLEKHYHEPQDVEWAIDRSGILFLLQTRPQRMPSWRQRVTAGPDQDLSGFKLLLPQAEVASRGIASGPVCHVREDDLESVPKGAVMVVQNTSPALVAALGRAAAIVADRGGSTGHLAIIAREFGVPALVNARTATTAIPEGVVVTVDALRGRVFEGRVEPLLGLALRPPSQGVPRLSQVYRTLEDVMRHIAPLHLTNPSHRSFRAVNCTTVHDITRFAHESAINAMFALTDAWSEESGAVKRLKVGVPLDLCLIDLGGGLVPDTGQWVRPEQVISSPLRALLAGMTTPGVRWAGHINIDLKGLISVFANTVFDPAKGEGPLGGRSYAIVTANYVNFSSRLGYHFTVVDAYCSSERNDNYVTLRFKGGAADLERRTRRAAFIGRVLQSLGFWVSHKLDLVNARVKKLDSGEIEEKLNMVGRLLGCARQLDVTMVSDATVDHYVNEFLRGNYSFARTETGS